MGLFDKLRHELIDIIDWTDDTGDTLVWRFPRYENEIKYGAQLVVRESQMAAFINEGKLVQEGSMEELRGSSKTLEDAFVRAVGVGTMRETLDWL